MTEIIVALIALVGSLTASITTAVVSINKTKNATIEMLKSQDLKMSEDIKNFKSDIEHHNEINKLERENTIENINRQITAMNKKFDNMQLGIEKSLHMQSIHSKAIFGLLEAMVKQGANHNCQAAYEMMIDMCTDAKGDLLK